MMTLDELGFPPLSPHFADLSSTASAGRGSPAGDAGRRSCTVTDGCSDVRRALMSTDASTGGRPHPDVLREVARLGGVIDERFEPTDWREETPVGERLVPAPVQAVLSVKWPARPGHRPGRRRPDRRDADAAGRRLRPRLRGR